MTLDVVFQPPLSTQAHEEVCDLQAITTHATPDAVRHDTWRYISGVVEFKSSQYYTFHFGNIQDHHAYKWIRKSKCVIKIKVFGWLFLPGRLNTHNMLLRGGTVTLATMFTVCVVICPLKRQLII